MPSQRKSDENSNPDYIEVNKKITSQAIKKVEAKNKPLLQSNEISSSKKQLSAFDKKDKIRFEKSGMKKGSLLKYFVKENPEEMHEPTINVRFNRGRSASSCNNTEADNLSNVAKELRNKNNGYSARENSSQDSEIECIGVVQHNQAVADTGTQQSESDSPEEFEADSPQVSSCDEDEYQVEQNQIHVEDDIESVINNLDDQELTSEDKIERWQRHNKRLLQDDEQVTAKSGYLELHPPPTKSSKLEVDPCEVMSQEEQTPDKSQCSNTSTPPLRIINVYTLSGNNDGTPCASNASASTKMVEKAKKAIFIYKEVDNSSLSPLIEKKNWRKVIDVIRKDLLNYNVPSKLYVSQLIRKAILCIDTRVSKDVQSESVKLLEEIIKTFPPYNGNGRDPSVKYYKGILEKVFDDGNATVCENGSPLYFFITEVHNRLEVEKNALQILFLVTQLVVNQYEIYEKEAGVKVHPPLFQYFLEGKEGVFLYNEYCQSMVEKCCSAKSDEEFCIYLKWVDLIARRLGKFPARHKKDYLRLITDFAKHCCDQSDLGLMFLMNITYKPFSKSVCESIFEKLQVVRVDDQETDEISENERSAYFMELCKTLLIKPADDIVSDTVVEVCKSNIGLTFIQTKVDANLNNRQKSEKQGDGRRKNVKGETRLHILCRPGQDNPVPDVRKHIENHPDDINAKDNFGNTPLHDCARNNKGNIIVALMRLYNKKILKDVDFLARNESLETPMHLAATYCDSQTTEIFKYFATAYGVIDKVLTAANINGELPFQLAPSKSQIKQKLTPRGYDKQSMILHLGLTLDQKSVEILEKSFELRKVLAWWSRNCV